MKKILVIFLLGYSCIADVSAGLGGNSYRGLKAVIQYAVEMKNPLTADTTGRGKTVLLDRYFNSEKRKDSTGAMAYWHYTWEEHTYPGFSVFGNLFTDNGAKLANLDVAPTKVNLSNASVYIIVDPDHLKDNPAPNYMTPEYAETISAWVKEGGVLLLMANDSANCDLEHINLLASKFGMRFTNKNVNMVKNDVFEMGTLITKSPNTVFGNRKMFLKDICTIEINTLAKPVAAKENDVLIAMAKLGNGSVLAVGDPWLYNEYVDGRRLPMDFDNLGAAKDIVKWLLSQSKTGGTR